LFFVFVCFFFRFLCLKQFFSFFLIQPLRSTRAGTVRRSGSQGLGSVGYAEKGMMVWASARLPCLSSAPSGKA
jgi:hypothetical protein